VSKTGLGKGLGKLMQGDKVAGKNGLAAPRTNDPRISRGMGTLLQPGDDPVVKKESPVPSWYFYLADLLLLLLSLSIFITSNPLGPLQFGFAAVCISFGAILSIIGVYRQFK
jgi:hypothetical protein